MADEAAISEVPERPVVPEQPQTETQKRGGPLSRLRGFLGGGGEKLRGSEDLAKGDVVNMFDALEEALSNEKDSSNVDLSIQNTNGLASRFLRLPAFAALFPGVDSVILGENREIRSPFYKEGEGTQHKSASLNEVRAKIASEKQRQGVVSKVTA